MYPFPREIVEHFPPVSVPGVGHQPYAITPGYLTIARFHLTCGIADSVSFVLNTARQNINETLDPTE